MRQDGGETPEGSLLELMHRASTDGDQEAWVAFEQGLQETVLVWLQKHPDREIACGERGERDVVAQTFEEMRQAVHHRHLACETLSEVLLFLWASLNGVILERLRVSSRPKAVGEGLAVEHDLDGHPHRFELWDWVQAALLNERERRLAYLLYHCGLQPAEIVRCCSQEWGDVQEVIRLRRIIFTQLLWKLKQ